MKQLGIALLSAALVMVSLLGCSGKMDDAQKHLILSPAQSTTSSSVCDAIQDWRTCAYNGCLWGGPDRCDGHSQPAGAVEHLSQGGCFAVTECSSDADCSAGLRCGSLAYAPCYFTPDGDGPSCTAYDSQVCTYATACVTASE